MSARATFWRTVTQFDRKRIDLWMGARNALGIALPLAAGIALGYTGAGLLAATGALNVAPADGADSYRSRAQRILASSVLAGAAVFTGILAGRHPIASTILGAVWAFAAGLTVCLGTIPSDIAIISVVVFLVYSSRSMPVEQAAGAGLGALGGGLLQTGLSIALWPIRGHLPERHLIADFYQALARSATTIPSAQDPPPITRQSTLAHDALASLSSDHRAEAERLFMLVSEAERIRLSVLALSRWLIRLQREQGSEKVAAAIESFLAIASSTLSAIARCLRGEPLPDSVFAGLEECGRAIQEVRRAEEGEDVSLKPLVSEARHQMDSLAGQLRTALDLTRNTTALGESAYMQQEARRPWRLRVSGRLATLRANFSLDSPAFRHAARLTICILLGDVIGRTLSLPRPYWLTITVAIVLKPDFSATFSRGILRLAGTYSGLILATLLLLFFSPSPQIEVLLVGVFAFLQRSVGRANYGILVSAVTALIVFLFSLADQPPQSVISARAINTTIGGILALAIYWVWPTREWLHAPAALANMLEAYRMYLQTISRAYFDPGSVALSQSDRARVRARKARSNLEASVDRLKAEPSVQPSQLLALNAMLASSHRFIHSVMALEAGIEPGKMTPAGETFRAFSQDLDKTLYFLAQRLRGSPVTPETLPNLREDYNRIIQSNGSNAVLNIESDRMTNSLNTLSEQVFKSLSRATS